MACTKPITDIAETILSSRERGFQFSVVKMNGGTLRDIFKSKEWEDVAGKYLPCADTLAKAVSGMVHKRVQVVIDEQMPPDKVLIEAP